LFLIKKHENRPFDFPLFSDSVRVEYLRKAGLGEDDIARMKDGLHPKGWQVHHNLPLDDGGTNDFTNLVLIKNDPYHRACYQ
jgi:hypothetical protein